MRSILPALALGCLAVAAGRAAEVPSADVLVEFNEQVLAAAEAEDGFLTLKGLRTATMLHLAAHDALSAIYSRYEPYLHEARAPGADPLAAVTQAAFAVASDQYPESRAALAALRNRFVPPGSGMAVERGRALGAAAAKAILARRQGDGWNADADYDWHPMGPGVYAEFNEHSGTPEGFVFGAGWAEARPFALQSPDQFRSPPPPAIDSDDYTRAYDEVKALGRFQTLERKPDQAHLALWWKDFAENSHNRLARDLVRKEGIDLVDAARLFALLNMGIYDGYVSVFDNKFHYNHWRPYTAIRWAANDGNPDTVPEETWNNLHRHTYAFPSYPSAHGTACAAAQGAIADTFGGEYAFTMRIPRVDIAGPMSGKIETHPPVRRFDSPWQAADECGLSRLYLGIHFRYDSTQGVALGRRIGDYIRRHYLLATGS